MGAGRPIGKVRRPLFHSLRAGKLQRAWRQGKVSRAVLVGDSRSGRVAQRARKAMCYPTAQGPVIVGGAVAAHHFHLTERGEMRRQDVREVNACAIP